jgi:hypothetical protein
VPINVRLAAHNGLKSDIGACPKCAANNGNATLKDANEKAARRRLLNVKLRSTPLSLAE